MTDAPAPAPAPAPDTAAGAPAVEAEPLVDLLDLELIDTDLWRGAQPDSPRERVFGGQVAAQALVAAVRSVDDALSVHSLHSYFLLPGDYSVPIVYDVERIRDGRSFATRRVVARQHGRAIYYLTANFHRHEEGFEHQDAMPEVPGPEHGIDMTDLMRRRGDAESAALIKEWRRSTPAGSATAATASTPTRRTRRARGCGCASTRTSARTACSTTPPSPTPATSACSAPRWPRTR